MQTRRVLWVTAAGAFIAAAFFLFVPPIAQDQSYHSFADTRTPFGIANFWNVVSNLPFAIIGVLGLWRFRAAADRALFAGILLTCFGSAYYHLAPSDARLIWDRLPMTVVFMSLLYCILTTGSGARFGTWLLALLLTIGIASVLWWSITGDLRPYVLVQFGPLLILIPALWFVRDARFLVAVLAFYALAKLAELEDRIIFASLPVSGHTIKHVVSALATWFIYRWRVAGTNRSTDPVAVPTPEPSLS
jgi:hypothetical protein